MDEAMKQRVNLSPKVMAGKPVIRGTRIPVELIVRVLAHRGGAATKEEGIWQGNGGQGNKKSQEGMRVEAKKLPGGRSAFWVSTLYPSSLLPFPCHPFPCRPPLLFLCAKEDSGHV